MIMPGRLLQKEIPELFTHIDNNFNTLIQIHLLNMKVYNLIIQDNNLEGHILQQKKTLNMNNISEKIWLLVLILKDYRL